MPETKKEVKVKSPIPVFDDMHDHFSGYQRVDPTVRSNNIKALTSAAARCGSAILTFLLMQVLYLRESDPTPATNKQRTPRSMMSDPQNLLVNNLTDERCVQEATMSMYQSRMHRSSSTWTIV